MSKETAEIAQISFYLAKPGKTFAALLEPDADVYGKKKGRTFDFDLDDAKCRFIYFETINQKTNPVWLDFINDKLPVEARLVFKAQSQSPNGILLISVEDRIFAASFGRAASGCLHDAAFEPDFGIKTAMNMCGNEEVRQTRTQSNAITPTHIDRQVGKPSDAFAFGLSEAEDLRYISAHMKSDKNVTLQGRDSLTIKVIGQNKLDWAQLVARCKSFLKAYSKKDYVVLFPNYKNFQPASEDYILNLDAALIDALKAHDFKRVQLGIPEFISDENYSFSYSDHAVKDNAIYAFLDTSQLATHIKLDTITIEILKARKIFAYSHEDDRVLSYRKWRLYNCIVFEQQIDGHYFVLSDGRWLEVDDDFYGEIIAFTANVLHEEACEAAFIDIDISDNESKKNKESIFNEEVCRLRPSAILFDRAKLKIGGGRKDKEFCDILDLTDEGNIRIINCKPYKDSSSINYLFSQAKLYCEAFVRDRTFLGEIRNYIKVSENPNKEKYLDYIKPEITDINGTDYIVCLWLLFDQTDAKPDKADIPLMAQYELKLMHEHLRNNFKFRDIILRFVPVKKTNYRTDKKPN